MIPASLLPAGRFRQNTPKQASLRRAGLPHLQTSKTRHHYERKFNDEKLRISKTPWTRIA